MAKFATFLTVCLFIVNGMLLWLRDGVKVWFPTIPQQIGFHFTLSIVTILLVFVGNGLYIWFFRSESLDLKVKSIWIERISAWFSSSATSEEFEGPLGRLTQLCINASRPKAVFEAIKTVLSVTQGRINDLTAQSESQRARLTDYEKSAVPNIALNLANHWRLKSVMPRAQSVSIDDPVYGRIYLDEELATVLSHPILQRLNRVKQLSFSYARFPSATHTRLAHSLGVAKNAELALNGIIDRGVCYPINGTAPKRLEAQIFEGRVEHIRKAKLAALLHDIGHGPFGHALDNYTIARDSQAANSAPDKTYGTDYILEYLSPTLESLGFDSRVISNILGLDTSALTGVDSLISEIIDSPLDADRMDYLIRDADMSGLKMGFTNTMALLDFMRPVEEP